jgi:sporulation protein YlmC with PRC-barrel domain
MKSRELIGKEVIDAGARNVGKVKEVEIDPLKWNVTGIIVTTGFMRSRTVQPGDIDKIGDKIVLKVAADKIQKA